MNITWEKLVDKGEAELVGGKLYLPAPKRTFLGQRVGEQMVLTPEGEQYFKDANAVEVREAVTATEGKAPAKPRSTPRQSKNKTPVADTPPAEAAMEGEELQLVLGDAVVTEECLGGNDDNADNIEDETTHDA
jgi:hypothetical protein